MYILIFIISAIHDYYIRANIYEYPRIRIQLYYLFEIHLSSTLLQFIVLFHSVIKTEASMYDLFFSRFLCVEEKKRDRERERKKSSIFLR